MICSGVYVSAIVGVSSSKKLIYGKQIVLLFVGSSRFFCSCNKNVGLICFMLERQSFIGQLILFQMWTSAAVTHVKVEALALTASTSTAVSALPGTSVRTVKQVGVAVLIFLVGGASSRVAEPVITQG